MRIIFYKFLFFLKLPALLGARHIQQVLIISKLNLIDTWRAQICAQQRFVGGACVAKVRCRRASEVARRAPLPQRLAPLLPLVHGRNEFIVK